MVVPRRARSPGSGSRAWCAPTARCSMTRGGTPSRTRCGTRRGRGRGGAFELTIEAVTAFRPGRRLVIVPGGGPFAEAVREMFKRAKIGEDAAHWMAVLGMDQYAHALAARIPDAVLVDGAGGIAAALQAGRLPVLAPYRWLRAADPLPHSWDVTSDSIAAWCAGAVGARRVVLIKPADGEHKKLVDSHLRRPP